MQVYIILFSLVSNLLQFFWAKESKSTPNDHLESFRSTLKKDSQLC